MRTVPVENNNFKLKLPPSPIFPSVCHARAHVCHTFTQLHSAARPHLRSSTAHQHSSSPCSRKMPTPSREEMLLPVVPVPRPGLPADFDIEQYLHATLKRAYLFNSRAIRCGALHDACGGITCRQRPLRRDAPQRSLRRHAVTPATLAAARDAPQRSLRRVTRHNASVTHVATWRADTRCGVLCTAT